MSVFFKDESGNVFHTYSAYARGDERGLGAYMFLDLTPKGRNETGPNYTGQRIVTVVVRSGLGQAVVPAADLPASQQNLVVGFAQFLLAPSYDPNGGSNNAWCATYIGTNALFGVSRGGVGNGGLGVSYLRLTQ